MGFYPLLPGKQKYLPLGAAIPEFTLRLSKMAHQKSFKIKPITYPHEEYVHSIPKIGWKVMITLYPTLYPNTEWRSP